MHEAFWFSALLSYTLLGQGVGRSSKRMHLHRYLLSTLLVPFCSGFSSGCLFLTRCYRDTCVPHPRVRGRHYGHIGEGCSSCMNSDVPEKLQEANLKAHISLWETRRSMARGTLYAAKAWRNAREFASGPSNAAQEGGDSLADDGRGALIVSAVALAVAAATLRVGGRAALMSVLGLDFAEDVGVKDNLDTFLAFFKDLGPLRYGYFLGGWIIAKTFCFDFLSIVLALGSGVVFGGVLQGALLSTLCATVASGLGFQLARTSLRTQVEDQLEKRPALRALEKVVSEEGFKTVVTLRLAPVLPIPLGAYNYVYGATSLPLPTFLAGMFIGSVKPYLLDSYLGVFGKSLVDGDGGSGSDLALVGTFFVVVLVGTFASQVASRTWEELNAEAEKSLELSTGTPGSPVDVNDPGSSLQGRNDDLAWLELWGVERSSLPKWFQAWREKDSAVRNKIRNVVREEWEYMSKRDKAITEGEREEQLIPKESGLPPPGPPLLDKSEKFFDVGAYIEESTAFPFVLMESFWRYSDPKLPAKGAGKEKQKLD